MVVRRSTCRHGRWNSDGDEPVVVHRRSAVSVSIFDGDWVGDQGREARANVEEPELQRNYDGVLEFVRRDLQARALDAVGHAKLWERPADADDGNRPRGVAFAVSHRADWDGFLRTMSAARKSSAAAGGPKAAATGRERRGIVDAGRRPAEASCASETG